MVPNSLVLLLLFIAFLPSALAYMISWPKRRLLNLYFALLGGCGGGMIFMITLGVLNVRIVWLSWVMLAYAMALVPCSVMAVRTGRATQRAREADVAKQRLGR